MLTAQLIAAMMLVESHGDPSAIGDGGRALGVLQIHACAVADVNRRFGTQYRHRDALHARHAVRICRLYISMHAPAGATAEHMARIWNGGPRGHLRPATLGYWRRVQAAMAQISDSQSVLNPVGAVGVVRWQAVAGVPSI